MDWAVPIYDWYCPKLGLGPAFRRETLRHAALAPGERVLDVGCGTGVLTRLAAEAVGATGYVVGIDPGPRMLAEARRTSAASAARIEFRLAAIEALPFGDASFDAVLSSLMLHHLPPDMKRAGLKEVYRVLKPGGRLIVVDVDRPAQPLWWLAAWPLLLMSMTRINILGHVPAFLREAGFASVASKGRWFKLLAFWHACKPGASVELAR
ncbi:MAG: methyltransferase domain-containing protein [Gammaproteobacteria bacterium]|nr:methyltransferase domain-containing protein [Gammaproteobacteria bacterium]